MAHDILGVFLLYVILTTVSNLIFSGIPRNFLPKWFKPKRFRGKLSPIYRVELPEYHSYYKVHKYELDWVRLLSLTNPAMLLVPFAGLFRYYRYEKGRSYGSFDEKYFEENPDFDPKAYYLGREEEDNRERNKEKYEETRFQRSLDEMNKEFNENYIE